MAGPSELTTSLASFRKHYARLWLSQEAVAEAAATYHTYVGLLGRGERKPPTMDVADRGRLAPSARRYPRSSPKPNARGTIEKERET